MEPHRLLFFVCLLLLLLFLLFCHNWIWKQVMFLLKVTCKTWGKSIPNSEGYSISEIRHIFPRAMFLSSMFCGFSIKAKRTGPRISTVLERIIIDHHGDVSFCTFQRIEFEWFGLIKRKLETFSLNNSNDMPGSFLIWLTQWNKRQNVPRYYRRPYLAQTWM